jgi:hypothetical protein
MRTLIPILSLLLAASAAQAAGPGCTDPVGGDLSCGCKTCGHGCGWHRRPWRYEGLDPCFNCGCNGSYKFPVPPLSTYHWPGMYSAQWMTEYRSPWRFPPLRAYTDETPASAAVERTAGEMEAMSSKLLR